MLLLPNNEKMTPRANCLGWWQWQQTKGVLAPYTSASFPRTLVAGEDTSRNMQDGMASDDAFLVS